MNKSLTYVLAALVIALAVMPAVNAKGKRGKKNRVKPITVTGVVAKQNAEDENSPLTITDEAAEKTYILVLGTKGEGLKELVGKKVKVTGVAGTNEDKADTLTVRKFEEVKEEDGGGDNGGDNGGGMEDDPVEIE